MASSEATTNPTHSCRKTCMPAIFAMSLGPLASLGVNGLLGGRRVWIINRVLFERISNGQALFNGVLPFYVLLICTVFKDSFIANYLPKWQIDDQYQETLTNCVTLIVSIGISVLDGASLGQATILIGTSYLTAYVALAVLEHYNLIETTI